jgi:hypothetical protein
MKLFHGTANKTESATALYFTPDLKTAKEFALALDTCGNFNKESYIYSVEIAENDFVVENDFAVFDCLAYSSEIKNNVYNPEFDWYIIKNPALKLEEHYLNKL